MLDVTAECRISKGERRPHAEVDIAVRGCPPTSPPKSISPRVLVRTMRRTLSAAPHLALLAFLACLACMAYLADLAYVRRVISGGSLREGIAKRLLRPAGGRSPQSGVIALPAAISFGRGEFA